MFAAELAVQSNNGDRADIKYTDVDVELTVFPRVRRVPRHRSRRRSSLTLLFVKRRHGVHMAIPVEVGSLKFLTKRAAKDFFKAMLSRYSDGDEINKEDSANSR